MSNTVALTIHGDTVNIPAGTVKWTNTLFITNNIKLNGAGTNSTFITNGTTHVFSGQLSLIRWNTTVDGREAELIHINFQTDGTTGPDYQGPIVDLRGAIRQIRITDCWFYMSDGACIIWYNGTCGVVDHCLFKLRRTSANQSFGLNSGYAAWATAAQTSTTNVPCYEDNWIEGNLGHEAVTDIYDGGQFTFRHNVITNCYFDSHETTFRAARAIDIGPYNTIVDGLNSGISAVNSRGGWVGIWSNDFKGNYTNLPICNLNHYRGADWEPRFGGLNGTNVWDNNAPSASATGTHGGGSGTKVLHDPTKSWTTDQWIGYSIQNTSRTNGFQGVMFGIIIGNGPTNITVKDALFSQSQVWWTNGDTYSIYFVTNGIDMNGVGAGILLSNDPPEPVGWPNQALEPCYQWSNSPSIATLKLTGAPFPNCRENFHYYNFTQKPGYAPLVYPHPRVSGIPPPSGGGGVPGRRVTKKIRLHR